MSVVDAISKRSTCNRGKPGCVFVKDNQILTTGYAGSPPKFEHCDTVGHDIEIRFRVNPETEINSKLFEYVCVENRYSAHCVRTIHAEQNAILQAARRGIALEGSICYVSMTPCRTCAMSLISLGVKEVIAGNFYKNAQESLDMLKKANIPITHLDHTVQQYVL